MQRVGNSPNVACFFFCNSVTIDQNSLNEVPAQDSQNHNSLLEAKLWVCMGIYRKIDEKVKLYINSY